MDSAQRKELKCLENGDTAEGLIRDPRATASVLCHAELPALQSGLQNMQLTGVTDALMNSVVFSRGTTKGKLGKHC